MALVARTVPDGGPPPGVGVHDAADYEASLQALLAAGAWRGNDVWVFAYGSLLWNPAFEVAEQVAAVLPGWHRAFCIRLTRFRGTPEKPVGLVWLAVSAPGVERAVRHVWPFDRAGNKRASADAALRLVLQALEAGPAE